MNNILNEFINNNSNFIQSSNLNSPYEYSNIHVPRVTQILQRCIHNDYLMNWANSLGFRHKSYKNTLEEAAEIGSCCHESIDNYITDNSYNINTNSIPYKSYNAYKSFLEWFNEIRNIANVEVIFHEKTLACKYFGGTLDGLYKINGKLYLVDYKTSNHITFKYALQLAAYRYMLKNELGINIDGCIILQLSKNNIGYNEYILDFSNKMHLKFINDCEEAFMSLVYSYYNIEKIEYEYKLLKWGANNNDNKYNS